MSKEDIHVVLQDLRQQWREFVHELAHMLDKYQEGGSLSKDEIEQERLKSEPLIEAYMKKSNDCIESLNVLEEVDEDTDSIYHKWQRFLG